jgi:peroxiredoxin
MQPAASAPRLELSVARPDGSRLELGALGRPALLFFFATYDPASQVELDRLVRFAALEKRVSIIGIALQPDAKTFLDMFQSALAVPFPLYFDPENQLMRGTTALGRVRAVPAFVALDATGRIQQQQYGPATGDQLRTLANQALKN